MMMMIVMFDHTLLLRTDRVWPPPLPTPSTTTTMLMVLLARDAVARTFDPSFPFSDRCVLLVTTHNSMVVTMLMIQAFVRYHLLLGHRCV
jgi:hypothetical protein